MTDAFTGSLAFSLHAANAGDGSWIHLVPAGRFQGRDGRGPYLLSDARAVIAESQRFAGAIKIPIDYDHQIDHAEKNGQPAPAAGWITRLEARADGIWGLVEWTARAEARIAGGEYRYISPVFNHTREGIITRVLRAGLTNFPNLPELKALFSASMETENMEQLLAELRKLLGLGEDADGAAILAAIGDMSRSKNSASPDPSKFVPIADFEKVVAELNSLKQGVSKQSAVEHVEAQIRAANMPTYLKDWGVALCSVNKPAFDAFIGRTKGQFNKIAAHSGMTAMPPDKNGGSALTPDEQDVATRMGLTADEFAKAKSFTDSAKG